MKRFTAICLLSCMLLACKQNSAPAPETNSPASAPEVVAVDAPEITASESTEKAIYQFAFTVDMRNKTFEEKTKADPRFVEWEDSPCGESPVMKVSAMPLQDDLITPDFVLEFDESGKEINRWGKPYNAPIGDLSGDEIRFLGNDYNKRDEANIYATNSQGTIRLVSSAQDITSNIESGKKISCPVFDVFGKDAPYLQCFEVLDPSSNKTRRIAFEAACT
jgi:hypothetical protein